MSGQAVANDPNPFDQFDVEGPGSVLMEAPRPGLSERFEINAKAASRYGTILQAAHDATTPSRREERRRFDSKYQSFPEWETAIEGVAALSGQVAGTIWNAEQGGPVLENMIAVGLGQKAITWSGRSLSSLRARLFAGAIDAAATNAVTDPVIQGIELGAGFREEFDPIQFASSVGLGAVAGGVLGPITHRVPSPELHIAGEVADWANDRTLVMPARQADMLDAAVRSDPMDTPRMNPDLPDGEKLDFGETGVNPKPKNAVAASETISEPVSLGDRLQPHPQRPDTQAMASKTDPEPLWKDNGTWKETDPDIIEIGQFGPVIDIEAHGKDWNSVSSRLKQMEAGEARGALDHPDLGDIDIFWGDYNAKTDKGAGLKKIYEKHPEAYDDLPNIVRSLELVQKSDNRAILKSDQYKAVIRFDYSGEKKTWLLSAYAPDKDWRARGTTGRSDTYHADTSSAAPIKDNITQKDKNFNESQRLKGSIPRDEGRQVDTSSTSLTDKNIPSSQQSFKDSQRSSDTTARARGRQGDTSSSSLANNNVARKDTDFKESRRAEGRMERSGSHQTDAHSSSISSTDETLQLSDRQAKSDPDLQAAMAQVDADANELQARLGHMSGELKRNADGVARQTSEKHHAAAGQRLQEIAEKLYKLTGVAAVRPGVKMPIGVRKSGLLGTHNTKTGVIRLKDPEDFEVLAHEVGHHIDKRLGKDFDTLMLLHSGELEDMAPPGYPQELWLTEGFAEFFRNYLANPNYAAKHAPRFNKAFTNYLKANKPDWLKGFAELQDAYHAWRTMPSGEVVSGSIVTSKKQGAIGQTAEEIKKTGIGNTIADRFHDAYTNFMDAKHPIQQAVTELAKVYKSNTENTLDLKVKDDPYKLARMMNGAKSAGHMDLMYGVHGYRQLDPEGPSLRDALIYAHGGGNALSKYDDEIIQDFGTYLWSRRALGEWERFESGDIPNTPDKFTRGDHQTVVKELEDLHPHFQRAAEMVYGWNKLLWKKKRDAGLISEEQYFDGLQIRDYVPGLRKQDYPGNTKVEGKGVRTGKQNQVVRFRGSSLDVINPLESLMMDAYETSIAIAHNDMIRSLKHLGDIAGHGSGAIVEEIPAQEIRAMMLDPIEVVEAAAKQRGYSKAES
nr:hypothetical protein [uncultured Cohaesibacter sp.]